MLLRIDKRLHRRLKEQAAAEGRSMNALIADVLSAAVLKVDERERVVARLRALGLLRTFKPIFPPPPSREDAIALTRGAGRVASEALEADRAHRW